MGKLQENKFSHCEDNAHWIYLTVKLKVYGDTSEYKYYMSYKYVINHKYYWQKLKEERRKETLSILIVSSLITGSQKVFKIDKIIELYAYNHMKAKTTNNIND